MRECNAIGIWPQTRKKVELGLTPKFSVAANPRGLDTDQELTHPPLLLEVRRPVLIPLVSKYNYVHRLGPRVSNADVKSFWTQMKVG